MWKDWLAFSRREQYGIVFLAILVFFFLALRLMLPRLTGAGQPDFYADSSVVFADDEKEAPEQIEAGESGSHEKKEKLPAFNPNLVNVTRLDEMGVATYAIVNWMKYLEAGGKFEHPGDIRKVYGLDSTLAVRLEASAFFGSSGPTEVENAGTEEYNREARIEENNHKKINSNVSSGPKSYSRHRSETYEVPEKIILEINTAGAPDFQKLKGIGEVYSKRIVAFREALGGFYSVEQFLEVYGISGELFERIQKQLTITGKPFRRISVNQASVRRLKQHPYLDFYQARDIVEYRKKNGNILKSGDLRSLSSFSPEQVEKILPYLSFGTQSEENLTKN